MRAHAIDQLVTFRGQGYFLAALVGAGAHALDQALFFHAGQHAGQAGAEDLATARDLIGFHRARFAQGAQYPPLLFGDPGRVQHGTEMRHQGFARV
ncbi:hypothetical protein D3C72_1067970 [compost metagenome]